MQGNKIRIGYCPTRRELFSAEEAVRYRGLILNIIKAVGNSMVEIIDINDINKEGLLHDVNDTEAIIRKFNMEKVDALFLPHCNFGTENLVTEVARAIPVPVLLWGPRDDAPLSNGMRIRDTQCGMFATGKVLRRNNVAFTYLNNSYIESNYFKEGFIRFIKTANVVRQFRNARVLQISTRPTGFCSVICNEGELVEKFGIHLFPVSLEEVTSKIDGIISKNSDTFKEQVEFIKTNISPNIEISEIQKMVALKIAIRMTSNEYKCNAAAIQCWNSLQNIIGIMPCLANSLLADEGFPCVCETDVNGAITALMLQAAGMNAKPVFFADITVRHPENNNGELLWHCGPFPYSAARDKSSGKAGKHWVLKSQAYGTCEWEIAPGELTIARFDGDHEQYSLFVGECKSIEGPYTRGNYIWIETSNWPKWERKLVEGPYIHHVVGMYGKVAEILYEACKYIPALMPDPVEPGKDELIARWTE